MVQAILAGRKTQTRRVVKSKEKLGDNFNLDFEFNNTTATCPYGKVGDVLWVRESYLNFNSIDEEPNYVYKASNQNFQLASGEHWKPSIHMPKAACRIWLEIVSVKVERLQDISEEDAKAEGIDFEIFNEEDNTFVYENYLKGKNFYSFSEYQWNFGKETHSAPVASYCSLWESIHGDGSWNNNPWVWVVEFKQIENPKL